MTKPNNLIASSDYATLKNDAIGTIDLYIGDSGVLAFGEVKTYEAFLDIGTQGSNIRSQIQTDVNGIIYSAPQLQITVEATISTIPETITDIPGTAFVERISPTRIRLAYNFYSLATGYTMRLTGKYQTVTADIATFLSPFN